MSSSSSGSGAFLAAAAGCSTSMLPSVIFSEQQTRPLRMCAPMDVHADVGRQVRNLSRLAVH